MRELGVVIARVPAMLRPQIQEAASTPQLVPGRLMQGESRLHAGREDCFTTQHSHGSSCVGAWLMGTRETPTLPSWNLVTLGGVQTRTQQPQPGRKRGAKTGSRKMQSAPELPDESIWHPSERRKECYRRTWKEDNRLSGQEEPVVQGQNCTRKCGVPDVLCAECRASTATQSVG